eukprot:CAMPEP_0197832502 /NCGR_PEP_ID=MMETSP1437-20131217/15092_1 /TAXON_ID=49252 ORGANISM="Eucampia antarctica, Strain CCMP1452" /NCGR_SAMPLE_ID=MMETSP1437 /ASSEMBLY_ACC=CAM_ASM_001096 /LENGTH=102 /DNA_ID=CAMNT_0043435915 /DNA_START=259 /DNA_END=567 /DNA_ORIENTATION=+
MTRDVQPPFTIPTSGTFVVSSPPFSITNDVVSSSSSSSSSPIRMARNGKNDPDIKVNILDDVDPFTLTALGFLAIAVNFFVFGNMGDGGIGGVVARIINTFN